MTQNEIYLNVAHSIGTKLENLQQARKIWDYQLSLSIDTTSPRKGPSFYCYVCPNYGAKFCVSFGPLLEYTPEKLEEFNERLDQVITEQDEQFKNLKYHGSL